MNSSFKMDKWRILGSITTVLVFAVSHYCSAQQLAPPEYQIVDRNNVNSSNGQVSKTVNTVSIGGEFGISHSVSVYSNALLGRNDHGESVRGFTDKFGGNAAYIKVLPEETPFTGQYEWQVNINMGVWIMRVHDSGGSADFKIMSNDVAQGYVSSDLTNYSYEALRDTRHSLVVPPGSPEYLLWTKPDGTEVWFYRGAGARANTGGFIVVRVHGQIRVVL